MYNWVVQSTGVSMGRKAKVPIAAAEQPMRGWVMC